MLYVYVFVSERVLKSRQVNHSETLITYSMCFDMSFQDKKDGYRQQNVRQR